MKELLHSGLVVAGWSLVALCIASGVTAVAGVIRRDAATPFGPGLVVGAVAAVLGSAAFPVGLAEGRPPWR